MQERAIDIKNYGFYQNRVPALRLLHGSVFIKMKRPSIEQWRHRLGQQAVSARATFSAARFNIHTT
ncbi:hypothetical protein PXNS11_60402 [Stutzerimonas xanthomarina]|nr:hypothetical protein PXNS11_60402 [Stutzerimonas xanthomarina]